jgi:alpha-L-fucosidase 2
MTTIRTSMLLIIIGLLLSAPASAQSCPSVSVRNPDGNYVIPGARGGIPYSGELALDAYVQPDGARRPSIVVIHGGGWSSGSRVAHIGQILEFLTRAGFNWFSVDYRLGGLTRFEESISDLRAALHFIRCRSGEFGIDAGRLVLLGEDSGAHLAALLAAERPPGVTAAVLIGGFFDSNTLSAMSRGISRDVLMRAVPPTRPARRMPPIFVVHGEADDEAPPEYASRYCRQITDGGGRCRYLAIKGASHRSENWWPPQWHYKRAVAQWISSVAGAPATINQPQRGVVIKDVLYSPQSHLTLDAFVPGATGTPVPAVIIVHGGGWEAGDKTTYVTPLFEPLALAGMAWFSIDYRLTPEFTHEDQLTDLRHAIRFVRDSHERFNIDPRRLFLVGESASGQMVTLVAAAQDTPVAGVVSFYGVYDFEAMVTDASPRSLLVRLFRRSVLDDEARAILRQYSPLYRARAGMPPVLLVNGTGERLWTQAQAFARRLAQLGVKHEVIALDGAPHGMENWEGHPQWMSYKRRVVEWIQEVGANASGGGPPLAVGGP